MTSRLDRLFVLLESGSNATIRHSAAKQLSEVAKLYPSELHSLLKRLLTYLRHKNWVTRIAAGQAVGAIADASELWQSSAELTQVGSASTQADENCSVELDNVINVTKNDGFIALSQLNLERILSGGARLYSTNVEELDEDNVTMVGRVEVNKSLGVSDFLGQVIDSHNQTFSDLLSAEDMAFFKPENKDAAQYTSNKSVEEALQETIAWKKRSLTSQNDNWDGPPRKVSRLKVPDSENIKEETNVKSQACFKSNGTDKSETTVIKSEEVGSNAQDADIEQEEDTTWCLDDLCTRLLMDLWQSKWEYRHGAATGLRELLKRHAGGLGKKEGQSKQEMEIGHKRYLEDIVSRILVTLALDQLSDFVSDEVVAPVRETCAQVLGVVSLYLTPTQLLQVIRALQTLSANQNWMVALGGLLGIKYILAARQDQCSTLLPLVYSTLMHHLTQSTDDDMRGSAASALLPLVSRLAAPDADPALVQWPHWDDLLPQLWVLLSRLSDLSTATTSLMNLLCALNSTYLAAKSFQSSNMEKYLEILFGFLYHNSSQVREASVTSVRSLLQQYLTQQSTLPSSIVSVVSDQLILRSILDSSPSTSPLRQQIASLWSSIIIDRVSPNLLSEACLHRLDLWLCQVMQPSKTPFQDSLLSIPASVRGGSPVVNKNMVESVCKKENHYIGGAENIDEPEITREASVMEIRLFVVRMLAQLLHKMCSLNEDSTLINGSSIFHYVVHSLFISLHLNNKLAMPRHIVGQLLIQWSSLISQSTCSELFSLDNKDTTAIERVKLNQLLKNQLETCLTQVIYYEEILGPFKSMQKDCRNLVFQLGQSKMTLDSVYKTGNVLNLDQCSALVGPIYSAIPVKNRTKVITESWVNANSAVNVCVQIQNTLQLRVQSSLAGALVHLGWLPSKLTPVIRPLVDSLRREPWPSLQHQSSASLSRLLQLCGDEGRPVNPVPKIVKNITSYLVQGNGIFQAISDNQSIIVSLRQFESSSTSSSTTGKPGRPLHKSVTSIDEEDVPTVATSTVVPEVSQTTPSTNDLQVQRRGASLSLQCIVRDVSRSKRKLIDVVPALWDILWTLPSERLREEKILEKDQMEEVLTSLLCLEVCIPHLEHAETSPSSDVNDKSFTCSSGLCPLLLDLLALRGPSMVHSSPRLRHLVAKVIATVTKQHTTQAMNVLLDRLLPLLRDEDSDGRPIPSLYGQMGALETLFYLVESLDLSILPYIVILIVPVLAQISHQNDQIRLMANRVFADLLRILPLESSVKDPEGLQTRWIEQRHQKREFLDCLMEPKKIDQYTIPIRIKAELRPYQQEGVNWLAFLNRYGLHGVLCDDLGLGKTLQTLCILAGDHYTKNKKIDHKLVPKSPDGNSPSSTQSEDSSESEKSDDPSTRGVSSIVVCPSTLTGHWFYEVTRFVDSSDLNPLLYTGNPDTRKELQAVSHKYNLLIASYEIVRNDIDFFSSINWNYIVLDEGHVIRNAKAKLTRCIKELKGSHRLVLTGTPIQNQVIELWSLFDFLMPGFLGSEHQFNVRFARPVALSGEPKATHKEQEQGTLALQALHRQVLPFMLRRMKEDVLKDLPPKIIQDYHCELTPLQSKLYDAFTKSSLKKKLDKELEEDETEASVETPKKTEHVFQALRYLRKVCNHPSMVMSADHPMQDQVRKMLLADKKSIKDLELSGKLIALKQLLLDCGLGESSSNCVVSQHRVLIFCQVKAMMDLVERLLQTQMSTVTFLRLDGSVPTSERHNIVMRFNHDPSIDILLLTTSVGGLGLNLTGADTVIFVENDWNPMKDLQAMDRAHRIGQRRAVNVYRMITAGTVEEKILNLQQFKLAIANAVVTGQNRTLETMNTDRLFDLFDTKVSPLKRGSKMALRGEPGPSTSSESGGKGVKAVIQALGQLWDQNEYADEYDLGAFIKSLD